MEPSPSLVIPKGCDFFDFSRFCHTQQNVFQNSHKIVILSEALRRSIANRELYGAANTVTAYLLQ
jgi:hypothetical protein